MSLRSNPGGSGFYPVMSSTPSRLERDYTASLGNFSQCWAILIVEKVHVHCEQLLLQFLSLVTSLPAMAHCVPDDLGVGFAVLSAQSYFFSCLNEPSSLSFSSQDEYSSIPISSLPSTECGPVCQYLSFVRGPKTGGDAITVV